MVDIYVRSMNGISELDMEYSFDCFFRQRWTDNRLIYNTTSVMNYTSLPVSFQMFSKILTACFQILRRAFEKFSYDREGIRPQNCYFEFFRKFFTPPTEFVPLRIDSTWLCLCTYLA